MMSRRNSTAGLLRVAAFSVAAIGCDTKPRPTQEHISAIKNGVALDDIVQIAVGDGETCAITSLGALYCAGGPRTGAHPELTMAHLVKAAPRTTQVSLGPGTSCAVQQHGTVVCWGSNASHIMPDGTPEDGYAEIPGLKSVSHVLVPRGPTPVWVLRRDSPVLTICGGTKLDPGFEAPHEANGGIRISGNDVAQVAVGWDFCVRTSAGEVRCWDGSPFHGPPYELKNPATFLPAKVVDIAAAWLRRESVNAFCALDGRGHATCWRYQMVPHPATTAPQDGPFPVAIEHPLEAASDWRDIAMAFDHSCGVRRDGSVWCAGRNDKGQLGTPNPAWSDGLQRVPGVTNAKAVDVGKDHSCALLTNGSVTCWGGNFHGQCGTANRSETVQPAVMLKYVGPDRL